LLVKEVVASIPSPGRFRRGVSGALALWLALCGGLRAGEIDAVTFDAEPGRIYLPLDEAARELGWTVRRDELGGLWLNERPVARAAIRRLLDTTALVATEALERAGAVPAPDTAGKAEWLGEHGRVSARVGPKRVVVSLREQRLRAWQGGRLVLFCRISSGRRGATPPGEFVAGPYKARMHRSSRYHNAPMPWSVQVNGHVFIHGFTSVPRYPASHGCIRLPLDEGNPARFFYEWIDRGTPVTVTRE